MIVSVFTDDTRKDKIAEFYDSYMPLFFLHGLLEEARYNDRNSSVTFAVRQEPLKQNTAWDEVVERSHE